MLIALGREQFRHPRVGCCGMVRRDMIYPLDYTKVLECPGVCKYLRNNVPEINEYI